VTAEDIRRFLEVWTANTAKTTRKVEYAQIKAFFNFLINGFFVVIKNTCTHPMIAKQY